MGNEGVAIKKDPGVKTLKIGKKLASTLVKQRAHDSREEAAEAHQKAKEGLAVASADEDLGLQRHDVNVANDFDRDLVENLKVWMSDPSSLAGRDQC